MKRLAAACFLLLAAAPAAADALHVKVGVLREPHSRETLSILDIPAADDTLAGVPDKQFETGTSNCDSRF